MIAIAHATLALGCGIVLALGGHLALVAWDRRRRRRNGWG